MSDIITQLKHLKVVPIISINNAVDIIPIGSALAENGLPIAEITFRSAATVDAIRLLRQTYPEMIIGAGTVLQRDQVVAAHDVGATFIVAPGFNKHTVRACQSLNIPIIPGVNNPSTIEAALEMGLSTLKFFPAEASGGIAMITALLAPYNQINLMPTGGISPINICDYLAIPQVIACGGSWMVDRRLIEEKNWKEIGRLTRTVVELTRK